MATASAAKGYSAPPPMAPPIAISSPVRPAISSQVRALVARRVAVMLMLRVSFRLSAVIDVQPKVSPALTSGRRARASRPS